MTFREIPVPIPNTEVKPKCAENTCGLPCWEDRLLLDFFYFNKFFRFNIKKIIKFIKKIKNKVILTVTTFL